MYVCMYVYMNEKKDNNKYRKRVEDKYVLTNSWERDNIMDL
jgi:hypothetical protein